MNSYSIRNNTKYPLHIDITGVGNKTDNLKNIKIIPAGQVQTHLMTEKRVSELRGQLGGKVSIMKQQTNK